MLSMNCADSWPQGSVSLEEQMVAAAAQAENLDENCAASSNSTNSDLDDCLTSLQWLQGFSIRSACGGQHGSTTSQKHSPFFGQQLGAEAPASPIAGDPASIGMSLTPNKPIAASFHRVPSLSALPDLVTHGHCPDEVDYKTNPHIRPPYSYATLICMAMQASKETKIRLSCIYKWITDNFCYFRHADPTWQNSIRHNLSLNKCFIKVPRQKDESGKGGFWKIDPEYAERLLSGACKKRRTPPVHINPALQHCLRMNSQPNVPNRVPGGFCVSAESQQLLKEFEEVTGIDQNWDPRLAEATMFGCWGPLRGHKRKRGYGYRTGASKTLSHPSSPVLSTEEPKAPGFLKSNFDWDALLDSALNGELSLNEGGLMSPIKNEEEELAIHDFNISPPDVSPTSDTAQSRHVDFEEETFFASDFLESPWTEDEVANRPDFLSSSNISFDQLFDLRDSLDINYKIESFL